MCLHVPIINYIYSVAKNTKWPNFQEKLAVVWDSEILENYNQQSCLVRVGIFLYLFCFVLENIKMKLFSPTIIWSTGYRFQVKAALILCKVDYRSSGKMKTVT